MQVAHVTRQIAEQALEETEGRLIDAITQAEKILEEKSK